MPQRFFTTEYTPTPRGGTAIFRGTLRRVQYGNVHEQDVATLYRMASAALAVPLSEVVYRSVTFDHPQAGSHTVELSRRRT